MKEIKFESLMNTRDSPDIPLYIPSSLDETLPPLPTKLLSVSLLSEQQSPPLPARTTSLYPLLPSVRNDHAQSTSAVVAGGGAHPIVNLK